MVPTSQSAGIHTLSGCLLQPLEEIFQVLSVSFSAVLFVKCSFLAALAAFIRPLEESRPLSSCVASSIFKVDNYKLFLKLKMFFSHSRFYPVSPPLSLFRSSSAPYLFSSTHTFFLPLGSRHESPFLA